VSKSTVEIGTSLEIEISKKIHNEKIPLLISENFLRSKNCGQIDLATFKNGMVTIYEIKKVRILHHKQILRINRSANLIAEYLSASVRIKYIFAKK